MLLVQGSNYSAASIVSRIRKKTRKGRFLFFFPATFKYVKIQSSLCSGSLQHHLGIFNSMEQCFSNTNMQTNHLGILLNSSSKSEAGASAFLITSKQH